ncbi:MAG: FecR domain-containing protein [Rhodospirillaceae bacterium]|nr:FecR domain-containing protein [Rhodospirillaceae bacterium]
MTLRRRILLQGFMLGIAGWSGLGSLMPLRPGHAQMAAAGRLSRSAGSVVVVRGGSEMPVNTGAEIVATDTIRTGADSRAEVTFSDGSVLTIGADSEVVVAQFAPDEAEANAFLDLLSGIVRVTVNKATGWGKFDVRTSTAVASVRGTEYLVDSTDAASAVFVVEGRVAVSSRAGAGTVVIRAGQGVDVTAEYVPLAVKTWGAKRRDAALARVTFP